MNDGDSMDEKLQLIKRKFVQKLKLQVPLFRSLANESGSVQIKQELFKEARFEVHKLAGSAKTFGFPALNHTAAQLESRLDAVLAGRQSAADRDEFSTALDKFLLEVESILLNADVSDSAEILFEPQAQLTSEYHYRILLADDDEFVQELVHSGLVEHQCEVVSVGTGEEVLRAVEDKGIPDLIVLDVNMPGLNGLEVLQLLKRTNGLADVPVIMLTRSDEDDNILKSMSQGAVNYITKPFKIEDLVNSILSALKSSHTQVLIADDDELICAMLEQQFRKQGYRVLVAQNGIQALELMSTAKPDVAVVDIMMAGMDGMTLLKKAKNDPEIKDIPVVMLSAKNLIIDGLESGAHDFITKPFDINELLARVSSILRRHASS